MLLHLRNTMRALGRELSIRTKPAVTTTLIKKDMAIEKIAPDVGRQWASLAEELEENLKNNQLRKIIESALLIEVQIKPVKPSSCNTQDRLAIAKICGVIADAKWYAAERDESKTWLNRALEFNKDNQKAKEGLAGILSLEGDPSIVHKDYKSASARRW